MKTANDKMRPSIWTSSNRGRLAGAVCSSHPSPSSPSRYRECLREVRAACSPSAVGGLIGDAWRQAPRESPLHAFDREPVPATSSQDSRRRSTAPPQLRQVKIATRGGQDLRLPLPKERFQREDPCLDWLVLRSALVRR